MDFMLDARKASLIMEPVAWVVGCGLLACALAWKPQRTLSTRTRGLLLAVLLACALGAAWSNFFQSRNNGQWIHRWDLFHTVIGAKYFPELGYDHLYDCAYVLGGRKLGPSIPLVKKIRDLETLHYRKARHVLADNDCEARFSPARRAAFISDLNAFASLGLSHLWHRAFRDKGYNGTPFYTLIAHSVFEHATLSYNTLLALALIDILLLALAMVAVIRTRGLVVAGIVLVFLSVGFPGRFIHMGGSFLRFDYLAALIMALCALASSRPALAGGLFAYATLVRAFPVLFVVAVAMVYAARWFNERRVPTDGLRFALGFGGVLVALVSLTFLWADGSADWTAWWHEIHVHTQNSAGFRVGFKHMFMLDGNLLGGDGFVQYADKTAHFETRRFWYWLASAALLIPVALRARRLDPATFAALFGTLLFFVLMIATRYYYVVLVLPLLADPRALGMRTYAVLAATLLLASAGTYRFEAWNGFAPFLYNTITPITLTVAATGLATWSAWRTWSERRALLRAQPGSELGA